MLGFLEILQPEHISVSTSSNMVLETVLASNIKGILAGNAGQIEVDIALNRSGPVIWGSEKLTQAVGDPAKLTGPTP